MAPQTKPKILIMGGGIAGLTLGQALMHHNIPFRIFERDNASAYRAQGYRIRISGDGLVALKKCLAPSLWEKFEASCATTILGLSKLDAVTAEKDTSMGPGPGGPGGPAGRPAVGAAGELKGFNMNVKPVTADRTVMREILLTGLEDHIDYGKPFDRYELTPNGITAYFADGSSADGDFLVGADGFRSKVRMQYLPQLKPVDTDGRCIYGKTPFTDKLTSDLNPEAQKHMAVIQQKLNDGTPFTLFMEPIHFPNADLVSIPDATTGVKGPAKDYIYWCLLSRSHVFPLPIDKLLRLNSKETADLSVQLTEKWHESLKPILTQQALCGSALRISSAVPVMPEWKPSARLTILGDAAHPMPPTAGLGAVSALMDVANLVDVLTAEEGITEEKVGAFEKEMRRWAGEAVAGSKSGGTKFFAQVEWEDAKPVDF